MRDNMRKLLSTSFPGQARLRLNRLHDAHDRFSSRHRIAAQHMQRMWIKRGKLLQILERKHNHS